MEDTTELQEKEGRSSMCVQLWEAELEHAEEEVKSLLNLVCVLINSLRRDVEHEATMVLKSPDDLRCGPGPQQDPEKAGRGGSQVQSAQTRGGGDGGRPEGLPGFVGTS